MDSNLSTQYVKKSCTEQLDSDGGMVLWNEGRQKLYTASPSVIRRGLCMVRDQGEKLKKHVDIPQNIKTSVSGIATKATESVIKYGSEIARASDPLAAAIALGGKAGVGVCLSRFTASQCAGLVGVIVSSITPQASVPLLLKKIGEDLEYLKKSLDIVRENPQFMANQFLSIGLQHLNTNVFEESLNYFKKTEHEATKGIHMSPTFQGVLRCVQIKVFASVMIGCASTLEGIPCFVPIHCLSLDSKNKIEIIIKEGLSLIMKKAETRKWNGKKTISPANQDIIDPYLASLYNTYSLSASLTDPYPDCSLPPPDLTKFTVDVTYIPEGENDNCKLEVLLHDDCEIVIFAWKEFRKQGTFAYFRHRKTTWTMDVTNGNLFMLEYCLSSNRMSSGAGELEKTVGWPLQRLSLSEMFDEAKSKLDCKNKHLSDNTYEWIFKIPIQYLSSMDINLDHANDKGITLLHLISQLNEPRILRCLLEKVENIDPEDAYGVTPLHRACDSSSFKAAKILVKYGANVNAITKNGNSPLIILASKKPTDITLMKMMLDCNAKRDHANNEGMRPIDLAKQLRMKCKVLKLLKPMV